MGLRWGNHKIVNRIFEIWSVSFDCTLVWTFSLTKTYAVAVFCLYQPAWPNQPGPGKEEAPRFWATLYFCALKSTLSNKTERFPAWRLYLLLQLTSVSNKECHDFPGTYSHPRVHLQGQACLCHARGADPLKGLSLRPWNQATLLLFARHLCFWLWPRAVSPLMIVHSVSQWGSFCFGGYKEVAGGQSTQCLLPQVGVTSYSFVLYC